MTAGKKRRDRREHAKTAKTNVTNHIVSAKRPAGETPASPHSDQQLSDFSNVGNFSYLQFST